MDSGTVRCASDDREIVDDFVRGYRALLHHHISSLVIMKFAALIICGCLISCANYQPLINSGISAGVAAGLQIGVKDAATRTMIANYGYVGAKALRSISGNPTPDELAEMIKAWIPADVQAQYAGLLPMILPLIVSAYQMAYEKWGKTGQTEKLYEALTGIAGAIENGCAMFATNKSDRIALVWDTTRQ
jgi:hypothetical protein